MKTTYLKASAPALLTILLCLLVQAVEQGWQIGAPVILNFSAGRFTTAVVLNLGLLACLPLIGGISSTLAKRLGHTRKLAVEAAMSPVALISAMLLTLAIFDVATTRALVSSLAYSSGILVGWVLLPAGALLLGSFAGWGLTPQRPWYLRTSL
ncbi:MAG TPA: hypothetical protein VMU28_08225 [Terriglobales bacterium]|nr:hypothetical protein [Terriglobales bacterium]